MYKYILFDLDGTLTDPEEGITKCVEYALNRFNITVNDRRDLIPFIGPPLYESFMVYYGLTKDEALKAVEIYRERFGKIGLFENRVYDGVVELLEKLKLQGSTLIIATSKPEEYTLRILDHFDLKKYFTFVAGATFDSSRVKKGDVIRYALDGVSNPDKDSIIMIGDRKHDVLGAKENGIKSIGVLYGYGDKDELETAGADFIADGVADLLKIIEKA